MNLGAVIVALVVGCLGGVLGALWTFLNLKINRFRKIHIAPRPWLRVAEVCLIMVVVSTLGVFLPQLGDLDHCIDRTESINENALRYGCPEGQFHPSATLLLTPGEETIKHLYSRNTWDVYRYGPCSALFATYFLLACWAAGSAISTGIVVPMLLIGASYGRMVGLTLDKIFGDDKQDWMDPGIWALIGSASFFGGVSRLTIALVVIMLEISNDVRFLLPIMVAVLVSKRLADSFTHGLYHALMEMKCIPFLDRQPYHPNGLDIFRAEQIMAKPVVSLNEVSRVRDVIDVMKTTHSAFPVVEETPAGPIFKGALSRFRLRIMLDNPSIFTKEQEDTPTVRVQHMALEDPEDDDFDIDGTKTQQAPPLSAAEMDMFIDLRPYVHTSAHTIFESFSVTDTYQTFRALALRHLFVVNNHGVCTGVVTRKDLVGQKIEEVLPVLVPGNRESTVEFSTPAPAKPVKSGDEGGIQLEMATDDDGL